MAHKKIVRSLAKKFINNVTKTALKIVKHQSKIKLKMVNKVDVADHINEFTGGTRRHRRQWDATQFNLGSLEEAAKQEHFCTPDAINRYQQSRNNKQDHNRNVAELAGIVGKNSNSTPADTWHVCKISS